MSERSYHHGNLRAELLAAAGRTLSDHGAERISLRELARETGVSKSAPHRHFADRHALLEALAIDGFDRLSATAQAAATTAAGGESYAARLRSVGAAFVQFAVDNPALLDLMFSLAKAQDASEALVATAARTYGTFAAFLEAGQQAGEVRHDTPERLRLLILATFQGIASMASTGRTSAAETEALLDDATALFTRRRSRGARGAARPA